MFCERDKWDFPHPKAQSISYQASKSDNNINMYWLKYTIYFSFEQIVLCSFFLFIDSYVNFICLSSPIQKADVISSPLYIIQNWSQYLTLLFYSPTLEQHVFVPFIIHHLCHKAMLTMFILRLLLLILVNIISQRTK